MNTRMTRMKRQRGISLVEMSVAIAILAVVLVGVFLAIQNVQFQRRVNQAQTEIPSTITAMANAYTSQVNTTGASTQILSTMSVWPKERVANAGQASVRVDGHFPGSTETVFANSYSNAPRIAQANQGFSYWVQNIPADACLSVLQALVGHRQVANLWVAEATVTPSGGIGTTKVSAMNSNGVLALNMATAATACSASAGANKTINAYIARL